MVQRRNHARSDVGRVRRQRKIIGFVADDVVVMEWPEATQGNARIDSSGSGGKSQEEPCERMLISVVMVVKEGRKCACVMSSCSSKRLKKKTKEPPPLRVCKQEGVVVHGN